MDTPQVLQIKVKRHVAAIACHTDEREIARLSEELRLLRLQLLEAAHQSAVQRPEPRREEDGDLLFA